MPMGRAGPSTSAKAKGAGCHRRRTSQAQNHSTMQQALHKCRRRSSHSRNSSPVRSAQPTAPVCTPPESPVVVHAHPASGLETVLESWPAAKVGPAGTKGGSWLSGPQWAAEVTAQAQRSQGVLVGAQWELCSSCTAHCCTPGSHLVHRPGLPAKTGASSAQKAQASPHLRRGEAPAAPGA